MAVVVVTRDRCDSLLETLAQLRALPERPEVVVVDNASSDRTVEAVRHHHRDVRVVALVQNRGAAARTAGVRSVEARFVAFSDDDSWWAPGALARAANVLDDHPRLALLAARVLVGGDEREDPVSRGMATSPLVAAPDLPGLPVLGFLACGAVVRRSAYLEVGGFDERFGVGGEEELFAIDLAANGWGLAYVEEVVAHHHPFPSRDPGRRRRVEVRNALWATWLRRPAVAALRRSFALSRAAMTDPAARAGLADAARGLPWVLRERRSVPPELERALRLLHT